MPYTITRLGGCLAIVAILTVGLSPGIIYGVEQTVEPRLPPPNPMNVAADALILRPVGLVMIPISGLVYIIGYPFARSAGNEQEAYQSLLGDTIDYTFHRPLGRGEPFD
jgi:hypothetical protein